MTRELTWSRGFAHTDFPAFYHIEKSNEWFILEKHFSAMTLKSAFPSYEEAEKAAQDDFDSRVAALSLPREGEQG